MKTLGQIASLVGGSLTGNGDLPVTRPATPQEAKEGEITFALEERFFAQAAGSGASALIAPKSYTLGFKNLITVDNPRLAMAAILNEFNPYKTESGIHATAIIGKNTEIGSGVHIGAYCVIGNNCQIGNDCVIHPHVTLYAGVNMGKRCIVHSGSVIGLDGFGFVPAQGKMTKIPQIGKVLIGDDVEIYANNCISRGAIGDTIIGSGSKLDSMNHIAHNVAIGRDCAFAAMNAFAGSSSTGNRVHMGGQSGVVPQAHIGDDSIVTARSGVTKTFPKGSYISGFPAMEHKKEQNILALLRKLPELFARVKDLEKGR